MVQTLLMQLLSAQSMLRVQGPVTLVLHTPLTHVNPSPHGQGSFNLPGAAEQTPFRHTLPVEHSVVTEQTPPVATLHIPDPAPFRTQTSPSLHSLFWVHVAFNLPLPSHTEPPPIANNHITSMINITIAAIVDQ